VKVKTSTQEAPEDVGAGCPDLFWIDIQRRPGPFSYVLQVLMNTLCQELCGWLRMIGHRLMRRQLPVFQSEYSGSTEKKAGA
jgi:hypothetical protein